MAHKLFLFNFLILPLFFATCNSIEPPPPDEKPTLSLALEDVSCIEAWIKLTTTNLQLPATITLKQNDQTRSTINLVSTDTLLYIDSLLPNQTYSFHATIQSSSHTNEVKSNVLSVTTMDTTSHNFTWQSWTFGLNSSSVLNDVAIIDENNIWAVGEIYMNDSLGNPDPHAYNAVHWDGTEWELKRIPFTGSCSAVIYPAIRSVFIFSENDMWFARGGSLVHFDGQNYINDCRMNHFLTGQINKIWGSSSPEGTGDDLYIVGNNGNIAHYNGVGWSRIESGTDVDLLDVWGKRDGGSSIWISGYTPNYSTTVLLKMNDNIVRKLYEGSPNNQNNGLYIGPISGGWTNTTQFTYILNWGALYKQDDKVELDLSSISYPPFFFDVGFTIAANDKNDILVSGESGMFGHYNGVRFYDLLDLRQSNIQYFSSDIKGNVYVTVGWDYSSIFTKAIITVGRR